MNPKNTIPDILKILHSGEELDIDKFKTGTIRQYNYRMDEGVGQLFKDLCYLTNTTLSEKMSELTTKEIQKLMNILRRRFKIDDKGVLEEVKT